MSKKNKQASAFSLEGRFLSFLLEDGYKIKYLSIATAEGERSIKLSKEARASVRGVLTPGEWIRVSGEQSVDLETEVVKYKAFLINQSIPGQSSTAIAERSTVPMIRESSVEKPKTKRPVTILMCQKSDCMKRGGKAVCQALQETLSDRGLQHQVIVKGTGCMKKCKAGPNLVMPDKTRYSRISAKEIPAMVDRHLQAAMQSEISSIKAPIS
jgi:(2Fe-2S) ferredoxin